MRILVVDEVPVAKEMLHALLEPFGEVVWEATGHTAAERFMVALESDTPFDLVCVDIGLPDMDGMDLVDHLRFVEEKHQLHRRGRPSRILVVTASESGHHVLRAFRAQADAYLQKPYTRADLEAQLDRIGMAELI